MIRKLLDMRSKMLDNTTVDTAMLDMPRRNPEKIADMLILEVEPYLATVGHPSLQPARFARG